MQRDYILRMIEQMAVIIARIRSMILGGDLQAGTLELHTEARRQGVDLELARALDEDALVMIHAPSGVAEPSRCWIVAELLYLDGLRSEAGGRVDDALACYRRALRLFLALDPRVIGGIPEASERIEELERRMRVLTEDSGDQAS